MQRIKIQLQKWFYSHNQTVTLTSTFVFFFGLLGVIIQHDGQVKSEHEWQDQNL